MIVCDEYYDFILYMKRVFQSFHLPESAAIVGNNSKRNAFKNRMGGKKRGNWEAMTAIKHEITLTIKELHKDLKLEAEEI